MSGFAITTQVSTQRVADLLVGAFEGGSNYWAQIVEYDKPKRPVGHTGDPKKIYRHADYPLCEGGAVLVRIYEPVGPTKRLDRGAIHLGLCVMSRDYARHWGDFLAENDDAETADVFLQCCLLGKVVYG